MIPNPIEIFFSYALEDQALMDDVRRQLNVWERNGRILKWHDRQIPPGSDWRNNIDERLNSAQIVLLFLSPHFIESRYCYEVEGQAALRRRESRAAEVIPIILRPCPWQETPFGTLQALPRDAVPVTRWPDRDEACLDVATGVMAAVDRAIEGRRVPGASQSPDLDDFAKWAEITRPEPQKKPLTNDDLTETDITVLRLIAVAQTQPWAEAIADQSGVNLVRVEYALQRLVVGDYVERRFGGGAYPDTYVLEQKGREFLILRNLV
jgi:TIR domain